ncbi:response regulator with chey-like receiver, aaa-type ATPase, and DNA-binding domains [Halogeometricum pallidum JCM 14848]|uniref:Response regulator with chey-like receiver, aaa-type ATPase, and DNA-binding domains n=1 Tax=Halogeometricum pallidum JCM 14848 TaxID=1227487 RepID=M0DF43_HALPD|nr:HalOD1 output domain-containing protein [Halogeometricum pallidum]ELZ33357.1 response regulator with chey-like receiver, aaa-type ATPase, and DNA-binding domains [Halogeometricum pallidum JCM 14848]
MSLASTVLHVDDDPDMLELSALSFRRAHGDEVEVLTASDAEEGLTLLDSHAVDCIISDSLRLADDTAFIVAARQRIGDVPIIFYTAKEWDDVALDALEADVSEYVRKAEADGITAVVERARKLASQDRAPTVTEAQLFEGRPCETTEEAVGTFPAEIEGGPWTIIGVHDWDVDDELGTTIAQVLAAYTGVDVLESEPLFSSLDTEALQSMLEPRGDGAPRYDIYVRFPYGQYEVSVSSEGFIAVRRLPETGYE